MNEVIPPLRSLTIVLLIIGLQCAAQLPGSAALVSTAPSGKITFMVFGDLAELRAYRNLVELFEQDTPGIDVEIVHIPSQNDYRRRLAADFAAGIPADVILINYRRYAGFAARGVLEPLGSYLAGSTLIKISDFYSQSVAPFRWQGGLMCIPQNLSSLVVYYNKRLFNAAKLPYPKDTWTWEEFLSTAKALTKDLSGDGSIDQYGLGTEASLFRVAPFIWQNGGDIVDDEHNPLRLALDSPAAMEALQWFVDLQVKHHVVPNAREERGGGQREPLPQRAYRDVPQQPQGSSHVSRDQEV